MKTVQNAECLICDCGSSKFFINLYGIPEGFVVIICSQCKGRKSYAKITGEGLRFCETEFNSSKEKEGLVIPKKKDGGKS